MQCILSQSNIIVGDGVPFKRFHQSQWGLFACLMLSTYENVCKVSALESLFINNEEI